MATSSAPLARPDTPLIAVSMGDPAGIGPEVLVKALADPELRSRARWIICGTPGPLDAAARLARVSPWWTTTGPSETPPPPPTRAGDTVLWHLPGTGTVFPARASAEGGALSLRCVRAAIALATPHASCNTARADAIVTAPISKEAWALAGESRYPGHTELFAESFASPRSAMMFVAPPAHVPAPGALAPGLHVVLATTHIPLAQVASTLTTARVLDVIELGAATMRRLGIAQPRVGVCGLNPHAGEAGLLGHEDAAIIAPAIAQARALGIDATGPHPADTIFQRALAFPHARPAAFDLVVAMYHDQGLIPLKLVAFDRAVNVTIGLKTQSGELFRTSPDHGTAYDIAGLGAAHPGSMHAALSLAVTLASSRP